MKNKVSASQGNTSKQLTDMNLCLYFYVIVCFVLSVSSRKKPWSWDQYLEDERAVTAPLQLFNEVKTSDLLQVQFIAALHWVHMILRRAENLNINIHFTEQRANKSTITHITGAVWWFTLIQKKHQHSDLESVNLFVFVIKKHQIKHLGFILMC